MAHYTYRITNLLENKHYIGVRTSKCEPTEDLGFDYFSSSTDKEFLMEQKINYQDFEYGVLGTFDTRKQALEHEIELHDLFDVGANSNFYNKSKQTAVGFDTAGMTGEKCWKFGTKSSDITRQRISDNHADMSGENNPMYGKRGCETGMGGKTHTIESKQLMKIQCLKKEKIKCPHCGLIGQNSNMKRWHFDNCKFKGEI